MDHSVDRSHKFDWNEHMKQQAYYFNKAMPDPAFGLEIVRRTETTATGHPPKHWHEHFQIYVFHQGTAVLQCENRLFHTRPGTILLVNSNEMHSLQDISEPYHFDVIRIQPEFLFSRQTDLCQSKYLIPLLQNQILFENQIERDETLQKQIYSLIDEYFDQLMGYELAVKAAAFQILVLLLRNHVSQILSKNALATRKRQRERIETALQYIQKHWKQEISVHLLAEQVYMSLSPFCRLFRQVTGQTPNEYLQTVRLEHAVPLLEKNTASISAIALDCGFRDANYFSRVFKAHYGLPPKAYQKELEERALPPVRTDFQTR